MDEHNQDQNPGISVSASRVYLESWKQISGHLRCSERTARRYQSKGLPVYHIAGLDRQRVFAYSDELDQWMHQGEGVLLKAEDTFDGRGIKYENAVAVPSDSEYVGSTGENRLRLDVVDGQTGGSRTYLLNRFPVLLGRDAGAELVLADLRISRRHARIGRRENRFLLEDLGSRNGTLLNGKAVRSQMVLKHGDRIGLGGAVSFAVLILSTGETIEVDAF